MRRHVPDAEKVDRGFGLNDDVAVGPAKPSFDAVTKSSVVAALR
jgi:hypothetical protein